MLSEGEACMLYTWRKSRAEIGEYEKKIPQKNNLKKKLVRTTLLEYRFYTVDAIIVPRRPNS
jgi:hypothetical protein